MRDERRTCTSNQKRQPEQNDLNQQQLQNARTALWRQDGRPLLTQDDAVAWLDEMGICLFLPRHAQLPAPASSFVEACSGEARAVPAPAIIDAAMGLLTRLVTEGRAVPLNLMGNLTEQPDFLATPEMLRWVAAVRGDRNWKSAPGGRTAPLVQRVWSALDSTPGRTAVEIREELGRELTEAAVMRALVELWTTLRAAPEYTAGEATTWSLMRDRYPREMAAGANTAQTTGLSALISLYLRQAVAATLEETEIFLSPLTARSRIREVLHGMLATRQFGTMPLGVQTLLYLEGTLPEFAEQEPASPVEAAAETKFAPDTDKEKPGQMLKRGPRRESQTEFRRDSRSQPGREFRRQPQHPFGPRPERAGRPERGEPRDFDRGKKKPFRPGQKPQWKRGAKPYRGPEERREFRKPGSKLWQKRGELRKQRTEAGQSREFGDRREGGRRFQRDRKEGGWQKPRRHEGASPQREEGRPERRDFRREGPGKQDFRGKPGRPGSEDRGRGEFSERPGRGFRRQGAESRKSSGRFGKPGAKFGKPGGRFGRSGGGRFGIPGSKDANQRGFRGNKAPRPGPRSGKNRKGQKDKPE